MAEMHAFWRPCRLARASGSAGDDESPLERWRWREGLHGQVRRGRPGRIDGAGVSSRQAGAEDAHRGATAGASDGRARGRGGRRQAHVEQVLDASQHAGSARVEQAVVAHPAKALGQDVLEQQPEEVRTGQGAQRTASGLAVGVAEGDAVAVAVEDVTLAEDAAIEIACKVDERAVAAADITAVDDPPRWDGHGQFQAVCVERVEQFATEHAGEIAGVEQ